VRAQKATHEAATHEEAKPENDKDTRALEQSYLARGQAARVVELEQAVADVSAMRVRAFTSDDPVALGALVAAFENDKELRLFLAPHGGGHLLAGGTVRVVTTKSPLGLALLGKRQGDEAEVVVAGKSRTIEILDVA
jgi:transcription elongation GreA/GreB family factor